MFNSTEMLNAVANLLKANGINPTKEMVISTTLKTLIANGTAVETAWNMVFGEGAFAQFAGNLHDALRAKSV